jgi:uncharacterized heparinase superfamily protein
MLRLLRTARYLKPIQVSNRLTRRLARPRSWAEPIPDFRAAGRAWENTAALSASIVDTDTASFLNEPGPLFDWQNPGKSHLWLYNLHYFDDLNAHGASSRLDIHRQWLAQWLQDNPTGEGVGWEPYPSSLRIVNWVKWLLAGNEPLPDMLASLFQQAHLLSQQLEYHLQGNHLLANAKALVFAGSIFEGEAAAGWLSQGLAILDEQHREQLLADGGHFELSPMYHSIILVDVLDVIQLGQVYRGEEIGRMHSALRERAASMASWLEGLLHPDGDIPFFNDAAFGIAPRPAAILDYAHRLGVSRPIADGASHHFDESGYIALRQHRQVALLDVAAIGPDYIPGHAHADTLSFEWSLFGQRVLVNSGTSEYGVGAERQRQRGTAAHNTVVVNGEDSSEVWSGFRVARRARPINVQMSVSGDSSIARASHTGYRRLRPKVTHTREWRVMPGSLRVTDTLKGHYKQAVAYFYVHPQVAVSASDDGISLLLPNGQQCEMAIPNGEAVIADSTWHPEFGLSQANRRIAVTFSGPVLETDFRY